MSRFSEWLENAMFEYGRRHYRQADLARDIHKRPNAVGEWLKDEGVPNRDDIAKLARHFGVTSRFIYGLLDLKAPDDLNDTLEKIDAITYRLGKQGQSGLLKELETKHAK